MLRLARLPMRVLLTCHLLLLLGNNLSPGLEVLGVVSKLVANFRSDHAVSDLLGSLHLVVESL